MTDNSIGARLEHSRRPPALFLCGDNGNCCYTRCDQIYPKRWGEKMSLKDWIELTERYGPSIWQWLKNQWFGFVVEASERLEELDISLFPDRFTRLKDECRPQYIEHFENQVTYHLESGWLVYGLPSIERWLERAGGDFGNLTVHQERQILKWRNRQLKRRVKGYGRLDA